MAIDDFRTHGVFSAAYELERTVHVVADDARRYRIELLKIVGDAANPYSARCYAEEDLTVQPTFPQAHRTFQREPTSFNVCVHERELRPIEEATCDAALDRALTALAVLVRARVEKERKI
jgi:hypothetical protein